MHPSLEVIWANSITTDDVIGDDVVIWDDGLSELEIES